MLWPFLEKNLNTSSGYIRGFDGIRAIAAILVVLTHLGLIQRWLVEGWISSNVARLIHGSTAVQVFFALSGFLITHLLCQEFQKTGKISLRNFYIKRALRILPLYYTIVILTFVMHVFGEGVSNYKSLAFAAGLVYNFIPKFWYTGVSGHLWSLAVEEHFYLIWPFLLIVLAFCWRKVLMVLFLFVVFSMFFYHGVIQVDFLKDHFFIERWTFVAGTNIAFGALVAICLHSPELAKLKAWFGNYVFLVIALAFIFHDFFVSLSFMRSSEILRALGFSMVLGYLSLNQRSWFVNGLENPIFSYLGKVSYGIYMYQGFYLSTGPGRSELQSWPLALEWGLLGLFVTVPLSYHFMEKPILGLRTKFLS